MSNKQTNPLTDWEIPTIWEIIDRMEFKYLLGEEKKPERPAKKKRKYTKRSKKKS